MQRIINDPTLVVEEMLYGYTKSHSDLVAATENPRVLRYAGAPVAGKVGIVTGGGSGHKPAFIGYIGRNMVDAVAVGEIFTSPSAKAFYDAFKAADGGAGVACLYGNYAGDNMNVKMARRMAAADGIRVETVIANDDVPSAPNSEREKRRGVAGEVLMWKIGGAKAALGASLDEVIRVAQKAIDNTRSVGVGLTPCTIPAVGKPNFTIEPGMMEMGIGHHGEPGVAVTQLKPAKDIAKDMLDLILPDLPFAAGDEAVVLVSGLGATPIMELYIFYGAVADMLAEQGMQVHRSYVGNYFTSLEMMGLTLTVMKVDEELKQLVDLEADSIGLRQFQERIMQSVPATEGKAIVLELVQTIRANAGYLSELDGAIGDGDHGINMSKGFIRAGDLLAGKEADLAASLEVLGNVLLTEIGGAMGPLYGTFFLEMAQACRGKREIYGATFGQMLDAAFLGVTDVGGAKVGDKTLVDTLAPAKDAYQAAMQQGTFGAALQAMRQAAEEGKDSTRQLVAKIGRASRLGERSRGVLDAGATSCYLILASLADSLSHRLAPA